MDLCRIDFALIPDAPLFRAAIDASQEITDEFYYNANVLDDKKFPPHVSLHICTVPRDRISTAIETLRAVVAKTDMPSIAPTGIEAADGGYVMLNIDRTEELMALHEEILAIAAEARDGMGSDRYGSQYIRELFSPHISLAKVERREQAQAVDIGRGALGDPGAGPPRSLDVCDIGERSERWDVLASLACDGD